MKRQTKKKTRFETDTDRYEHLCLKGRRELKNTRKHGVKLTVQRNELDGREIR